MSNSRSFVALSALILWVSLSCDDPTLPEPDGPASLTASRSDLVGPVPGPMSDEVPEPGPASDGPEPTLSAGEETIQDAALAPPSLVGEGLAGTDLLWRNSYNGKNAIWGMDGTSRVRTRKLPRVGKADWIIVGAGDLTGDVKPDIVWRNTANGKNAVWEMDNGAVMAKHKLPRVEDLTWEIVGVGDLTGDGKPDLLWQNETDGYYTVWEMDGLQHVTTHFVGSSGPTLDGKGVGDLTGDGKNDILFRGMTNGRNYLLPMDGLNPGIFHLLEDEEDLNWDIVGLGDMTGDGKTDIVWRNTETGKDVVWEMDGLLKVGVHGLGRVADTNWDIVGVADLVWGPWVEKVEVSPASWSLIVGYEKQLLATPLDDDGNPLTDRVVLWESSDPAVAEVSDAGVVTAVSEGEATISATIEGETATAKVTNYVSNEEWLEDHPEIASWIFFQTPDGMPKYPDWPSEEKTELDTYFLGALNGGVSLPDPPENLYADYLLDDDLPLTLLSPTAAKSLYLANIGHSLAMERSGVLGWSLLEYDDAALGALLRYTNHGFYLYEGFNGTSLTGYFLHPIYPMGVLPAPPSVTYSFLTEHALVPGDRMGTIARVIDWGRVEMVHDQGQSAKSHEEYWQYRGAAPLSRILSGTFRLTDPTQTVRSYTPGCGGTTLFLTYLLRAVNIPVMWKQSAGHWGPHFLSEGMILPHADEIYNAYMRIRTEGDPIPSEDILISEAQWETWFDESVPPEEQDKNLNRRMAELVQKHLPDQLLWLRCRDREYGVTHQESEVYNDFLKTYYSVEELEALTLWERLDQKIADVGGCPIS